MRKYLKIVNILILSLILLMGCTNKSKYEKEYKEMKSNLTEEAKKIFLTDEWIKGRVKEDTYTLTLKDLKQNLNLDISKYKNPETKKECDDEKSKIDFIVSRQTEPDKTNYTLNVTLVCE